MKMMKLPTLSRYTYIFAALNVILLLTGVLTLLTVLNWRNILDQPISSNPDIYTRLAVNDLVIYGGFVGAASTFLTVAISLWTFATRPTRENAQTLPLRAYMSSLFTTLLITLIAASLIWFSTLRERSLFTPVWEALPAQQKIFIQNDLKCCGWFNATLPGLFNDNIMSGFCEDPDIIRPDPDPNVVLGCVDKFGKKADDILNNTFTLSYGFTGVQFFLFVTAAALANLRIQQKRLASGGELFQRIYDQGKFTEADAIKVIRATLSGIAYLHTHQIVHRDLKPENLLYKTRGEPNPSAASELLRPKSSILSGSAAAAPGEGQNDDLLVIADFGIATSMSSEHEPLMTMCGSPGYAAPEILNNQGHGKPVDLWSIGVITYTLLCGYSPFRSENRAELIKDSKEEMEARNQCRSGYESDAKDGLEQQPVADDGRLVALFDHSILLRSLN
ncbi:phospholipid scramblase 1 [Puccinia graminis f. sp. tritici]|uniref:Phospholipid scramblase 1 n=1 Tax=Puccinia graminis f. sp. tritici TaxID=56615 RepID=A0A5B0LN78_PUCGR|nr:phospholipid scramblase 1 [Puccinia graminis f. sp. tritici]